MNGLSPYSGQLSGTLKIEYHTCNATRKVDEERSLYFARIRKAQLEKYMLWKLPIRLVEEITQILEYLYKRKNPL